MRFISINKIELLLSQYIPATRLLIISFLLLLLLTLWWKFVYSPLHSKIINYETEIDSFEQLQKKIEDDQLDYLALEAKVTDLELKLKNKTDKASKNTFRLAWLLECFDQNNISLKSCIPKNLKVKKWYTLAPFEFVFESKFSNLLDFFESIVNSGFLIRCDRCELKKTDKLVLCSLYISFLIINK